MPCFPTELLGCSFIIVLMCNGFSQEKKPVIIDTERRPETAAIAKFIIIKSLMLKRRSPNFLRKLPCLWKKKPCFALRMHMIS